MKKDWNEIVVRVGKVLLGVGAVVGNAFLCSKGLQKVFPEDWCRY